MQVNERASAIAEAKEMHKTNDHVKQVMHDICDLGETPRNVAYWIALIRQIDISSGLEQLIKEKINHGDQEDWGMDFSNLLVESVIDGEMHTLTRTVEWGKAYLTEGDWKHIDINRGISRRYGRFNALAEAEELAASHGGIYNDIVNFLVDHGAKKINAVGINGNHANTRLPNT